MLSKSQVADKDLLRAVRLRLSRMGGGTDAQLSASVNHGVVTLTGRLQFDTQRVPILKMVGHVPGVYRVVDQLQLVPRTPQ